MKKIVTINDIALALNLSRNTVSKALNGRHVPIVTREKVLQKAKELNYKSMNYSNETQKERRILLLSGKPLSNINYYLDIIRSLENYCYNNTCQLFQYIYNEKYSSFDGVIEYLKTFNIDGIICIESFDKDFIKQLIKTNFPICFIDFGVNLNISLPNKFDIIEQDNQDSIHKIVNKLIKKNNISNFAFVGDKNHCLSFYQRYLGMQTALARNNITYNNENDISLDDSFEYGNPNVLKFEIMKKINTTHCFVCANDFIARSVINSLKSLNKSVPKDVLVIGFDDSIESINSSPNITTVSVNKNIMGETAIKVLLNRIIEPSSPSLKIIIESNIIERESTEKY